MATSHMRVDMQPVPDREESEGAFGFLAILLCLLVSVGLTALVCFLQMPKFAAPDDFIQALYARGALFNTRGHLMPFSFVAYSAPLCMLYAAFPSIPWYPVSLMGLQAISFAAMFNLARKIDARIIVRVFVLIALGLCELMVTAYLSFSVAAFVTFSAGMSLILAHACFDRPESARLGDILGYLLIIMGVSIRYDVCFAGALVFLPFLIWALVHNRNLRTMLMALGVVACMVVSYAGGLLAWRTGDGWQTYGETQDEIASVADYPRVDYQKAQEVAPKLSDNDIDMIYEFLFVDADTYDLDTFKALNGVVKRYGMDTFMGAVRERPSFTAFVFGLAAVVFVCAILLGVACGFGGRGKALLIGVGVAALLVLLLVFLRARPKMHVILPLFVSALFALVVGALNDDPDALKYEMLEAHERISAIFPVLGVVVFLAIGAFVEVKYALPLRRSLSAELTGNMQRYVDEHDKQLVSFTLSQGGLMNYDAFEFDKWAHPKNAVFIGGYEYYTTPWRNFLEGNGLSRDHFLNYLLDGERMVTVGTERQAEMVATYLSEHNDKVVKAEKVASMGKGTQSDDEYFVWRYKAEGEETANSNKQAGTVPAEGAGIPTTEDGRAQAQAEREAAAAAATAAAQNASANAEDADTEGE